MPSRLARSLVTAAGALLLALLLNLALAQPAAMQPQPAIMPQLTPAAARTAAPNEWFSATASLTVDIVSPVVGDAVTVTAQLATTGTCGFALYDVTLEQDPTLFTYVDPSGNVIGPPGENPAIWRLAAAQSGITTFTVSFYGETNCDGSWQWTTVRSEPLAVTVTGARINLPLVSRNVPPVPITDLGTLGGDQSIAKAINNRGEIAGASRNSRTSSSQQHAFFWRSGVMTDLGALIGTTSWAVAINERGEIAGFNSTFGPTPPYQAFFWADGVMTDIGTLGGVESVAVDINLAGQVLGISTIISGSPHSFIWASGVMTDLGTLGGEGAYASDINDRGQVVGYSRIASGAEHAFLWQNGVMTDINPEGATSSAAEAINERGQIAGTYTSGDSQHTFLWEQGVFTDLVGADGSTINAIEDLNNLGQVVGSGSRKSDPTRPFGIFLWSNGNITDLGNTGYGLYCPALLNDHGLIVIDSAAGPMLWRDGSITPLELLSSFREDGYDCPQAINDRGQIVGSSTNAGGESHAVLWDASGGE